MNVAEPPTDVPPSDYAPAPADSSPPGGSAPGPRRGRNIAVAIVILLVVAVVAYAIAGFTFATSRLDSARTTYNAVVEHQNAMTETVRSKTMFRDAYRKRHCIVPVEGFFEWQATKGGKQPYAIAMKNGAPFGLAGLWENWKDPASGDWVRTFTIITVPSNELIARIHDRMPAILRPADYERWLGSEPDPHDLLIPSTQK